ncbi:MAG: hypothetical protein IJ173_07680 [Kiritimatiellae bacterium]|nr:hypothetical protein [Kiritimatiellia bacterium]
MNTIKAGMARAGVLGVAVVLGTSAFAGLLYEPSNYAAQDHLVLQLDGIRNAGALKAHDNTANAWVDLKSASRKADIKAISSISGRSVPETSLKEGTAEWKDDGYYFDGITFLLMSDTLTLGNTYTIQVVCDVDTDKFQTRFTASQSVAGPPSNDRELKWPGFVGSTDTDGKDYCNIYYHCTDNRVNAKMGNGNFDIFVAKADWNNRYLTAWANGTQASLFDGAAVGTKTSKDLTVGTRTLTFGASYGSTTYGAWRRSLVGTIKAVRIYNKALSDDELAANRALDETRFFAAAPVHAVVTTSIAGLEGNEAGEYAFDAEGYTFTAPAQATLAGQVYDCTGYTLETADGETWGEAVSYDGTSCLLADTTKKVRLTWQWKPAEIVAQDYTWMASPANATWDASSANWNGGAAWADGNNAIFGASSQTALTVPSERLVNDLTINNVAYTFNGAGPLRVKGTITPVGAKDQHFNVPLASGRDDGALRFYSTGVDWRSAYLDSINNLQTKTVLAGTVFLMAKGDGSFGPAPAAPAENIVIESGNPTIYGNGTVTVNANRIVKLASGAALWTGSNSPFTYKSQIVAEPDAGSDYSQDTYVKIRTNWGGLVTFDPGENRTNAFGRLVIDTRRLKLASGTTVVTGPATSIGESAILYVKGNGSAFSTERGYLLVDGGELYSPKMTGGDRYVDVGAYGQVVVTNGGKVVMAEGVQWLNGLTTPGKLTVAKDGSFTVEQLRISQSGSSPSEVHLDEGGLMAVHQLRMDNASTGLFAFNGGCLQAIKENENRAFYAGAAANWENVTFTVGEKGAGFDLSNGVNLWWGKPLTSGAESDGGLFKKGSGILVLLSVNNYNGPTVIESGRIQARVDHAIPDGTVLRLVGGEGTRLTASCYDSETVRRDTVQMIGRVEGSGELDDMGASSVGGVAPTVGGTINFMTTCSLSGDYEVTIGEEGACSLLKVAAGQDISGLKVKIMNAEALDRETKYTILDAASGYVGKFDESTSTLPDGWGVKYTADGACLRYNKGLVIILR